MNRELISRFISFAKDYVSRKSGVTKKELAKALTIEFGLERKQSVYTCRDFCVRFSKASGKSFSNVVLSLSTLKKYDDKPFLVCIVRSTNIEFLLANSTLLDKISHSSHELRVDNIRGSFLGNNILRSLGSVSNKPENFHILFELHQQLSWEENLNRLVECTNKIVPHKTRIELTDEQVNGIYKSVDVAYSLSTRSEYRNLGLQLDGLVQTHCIDILDAGKIDNIKLRGETIEGIITGSKILHSLENTSYKLGDIHILIDVKSKLMNLSSSPKGYNIDKVLSQLSLGNTVLSYLFVGIDLLKQKVYSRLVSIIDTAIIRRTHKTFHWAGRGSRGVTQLTGDLNFLFSPLFRERIDLNEGKKFLQGLINL